MKQTVSFLLKSIKWLLLTLLIIVLLLVALLAYFTATETGYRQLPRVISLLSPYEISYRSLEGHFWSQQSWQDLSVHGPGIDLHADSLIIDNDSGISPAKVAFSHITLSGADIELQQSNQPKDQSGSIPQQLPQIDLPFDVLLNDVRLTDVTVSQSGVDLIHIDEAELKGHYKNAHLLSQVRLRSDLADAQLDIDLTTLNDYPLALHADARLHNLSEEQQLKLAASGSVLQPSITISATGYANVDASVAGNIELEKQLLDLDVAWQQFTLADIISSKEGHLHAEGPFEQLAVSLNTQVIGQQIPQADINGGAEISSDGAKDINLGVNTLNGSIDFAGNVSFAPVISWQGKLTARDVDGNAYQQGLDLALSADVVTEGELSSNNQHALLTINLLQGSWQGYPLDGNGTLVYENGRVDAQNFHLDIAKNILTASGELGESGSALTVMLDGSHLDNLTPAVDGNVKAQFLLSGSANNPDITGTVKWRDLSYTNESGAQLLRHSTGDLDISGQTNALNLVVSAQASGRDFPISQVKGRAIASAEQISNIELQLASGEGQVHVSGDVVLMPDVAWDLNLVSEAFDPGRFVADYPGRINADIDSNGSMASDGTISASAVINKLDGTLLDQPLEGSGLLHYDDHGVKADNLLLDIAGNRIHANGELNQESGQLLLDIDAAKLGTLLPGVAGAVSGKAMITGAIDDPNIDADLQWLNLSYEDGQTNEVLFDSKQGTLHAKGNLQGLDVQTDFTASGRDFPQSSLSGHALVSRESISDINLELVSGEGRAHVNGSVTLQPDVAWDLEVESKHFDPSRFAPDYPGNINAHIASNGQIASDGSVVADVVIKELGGTLLDYPLAGNGAVHYDDDGVRADNLMLDIANNRINANGELNQTGGQLALSIDAGALGALLPNISGELDGKVILTGAIDDPDIGADLQWQNLRYRDLQSDAILFDSQQGSLQAKGRIDGLDVQTDLTASGRDFPQSRLNGSARVSPKRVSDIDLTLHQGDGRAIITGSAELQPEVSWAVSLQTENFNPGPFVEGYEGKVNADVVSEGRISKAGKVNASADIKSISGTLNGEPLRGQGSVILEDGSISMQKMEVGLGENKFAVSGGIADGKFDMAFNIEGRNLSSLYKPLGGRFDASGSIKGDAKQPEVNVIASAKKITYQDYRINSADVRIDSALRSGGSLNNAITLSGVSLAGQQWQSITLNTDGQFNQHTIKLTTSGGEFNLNLAAQGGLQSLDSWVGRITQLSATGGGMDWHLQQPSALAISPQSQKLDDFCMGDGVSGLCVDVEHDRQTAISYRIDQLSPKSFAAFIPDMIRTTIAARGKGDVRIAADGQMSGQADISFTPGKIVIAPGDSAPVTLNLTEGRINAAFKGQQANIASDIAFADAGKISLRTRISNFSAPQLDGQLAVNIPDIGEFRYLVPMVSDMRGNIEGNLRFSGAASNPAVGGEIVLADGYIVIPEYATELSDIRLQLSAAQSGQIGINGRVGTPRGALDIHGALDLSPVRLNLNLDGQDMLIADAENMRIVVTPSFDVTIDPDHGVNVDGKVAIPEARVSIPDTSGGVSVSKDVIIVGKDNKSAQEKIKDTETPFNARIAVELGDQVYFSNSDINLRLIGGITVFMRPNRPITAEGTISVASGIYELYGQELDIKRGRVTFSGGNIANPTVEVLALREIADVKAGARITGDVEQLQLTLTSTPAMPDSAILSYLLFGRAPDSGTDTDALLQTAASYTLGGVFPDSLAQETGLDVLDIGITGMKAGKYLGDDFYVGMQSNFFTAMTEFIARYQFSDRLKAEATANGQDNAIDFIYEFESN